jgi:hypothetical protein
VLRKRIAWGIGIAVLIGAAVATFVVVFDEEPSYAELRQAARQRIPGALGFVLDPPPHDFEPAIAPARAKHIGTYGGRALETAVLTLAIVRDQFQPGVRGGGVGEPAWVVVTRGICIRSFKGELVASSRHPETRGLCTAKNLWLDVVDPDTGERVQGLRGYDESERWAPDVVGLDPAGG